MNEPTSSLSEADWKRLLVIADHFETAWSKAEDLDLRGFLPAPGTPLFQAALLELVKTDLEIRTRRGQRPALETYLSRHAELGKPTPDLMYEEYRARMLFGDQPALESYRQRFPALFEEFAELVKKRPIRRPRKAELPAKTPVSQSSSAQVLPPGEGYKLLERIGTGQYGEVFRALAPGGGEVAVKRIFRSVDPDAGKRELAALELIRTLRHAYILQTHATWSLPDRVVMVMELADDSLADWYQQCRDAGQPGIPARDLAAYLREAAEAIDFMHDRHVIHRDIKPANLLRLAGHAKVADFGLARLQDSQVMSATFCGTPMYMAPEVWGGKVSKQSDQYSLAMTYAELRLGHRLFPGILPDELGAQHLRARPDLHGAGGRESRVLLRALAKRPDQRFPSCRAFADALLEALEPRPSKPPPFPWALALILVGLLLLVLLALVAWRHGGESSEPSPNPPARQTEDLGHAK